MTSLLLQSRLGRRPLVTVGEHPLEDHIILPRLIGLLDDSRAGSAFFKLVSNDRQGSTTEAECARAMSESLDDL